MFKLHLYTVSSEVNRVDKSSELSEDFTLNGTLKDDCSIIDPEIVVSADATIVGFNYVYVEEFKRYYFINDITAMNNGMWLLSMHVDVLMSFKDGLLGLNALIARNEKTYNELIIDPLVAFTSNVDYEETVVDSPFTESCNMTIRERKVLINVVNERYPTAGNHKLNWAGNNNPKVPEPALAVDSVGVSNESIIMSAYSYYKSFINMVKNTSVLATFIVSMYLLPFKWAEGRFHGFKVIPDNPFQFKYGSESFEVESEYDSESPRELQLRENASFSTSSDYSGVYNPDYYPTEYEAPMIILTTDIPLNDIITSIFELTFLDYEPYSSYALYVPYVGWIKIDAKKMFAIIRNFSSPLASIKVRWAIDPTNGVGTYAILVSGLLESEIVQLEQGSTQVLQPLAISFTTADAVERNKISNTLNLIGSIFGSVARLGTSAIVGMFNPVKGVMGAVGGISSLAESVVNYAANEVQNVETGGTSPVQSVTGNLYLQNQYIFRRYSVRRALTRNDDYLKLVGAPLKQVKKLSEVHGFTTIDDVHLEDFYATSKEKDEIMQKLKTGIILP